MSRQRIKSTLIFILLIALADILLTASLIFLYPKKELGREAFYSETHTEGLKDYSLSDDGVLTVLSDDPWMSFTFDSPARIYSLKIRVSEISGSGLRRAQVYLLPGQAYKDFELTEDMHVVFGFGSEGANVSTLRLDLGSVKGLKLSLESVTINSRRDVALASQIIMLKALFIIAFIMAAALSIKKFLKMFTAKGSARLAAMLIFLPEVLIIILLRRELMGGEIDPAASYSAWLFIFGLIFLIMLMALLSYFPARNRLSTGYILCGAHAVMMFGLSESLSTYPFSFDSAWYFILGLILCYLFTALIYTLIGSVSLSLITATLALTVLSIANYYYSIIRAAPLEYFDLRLLGTALNVVNNYSFPLNHLSLAAIISLLDVSAAGLYFFGLGANGKGSLRLRGIGIAIIGAAIAALIALIPTKYMSTLFLSSRDEGYFLHFVSLMKMGRISKPEGYSAEEVTGILEAANAKAPHEGRVPDIIVVMDESWADLPDIFNFKTSEDVLPFYHSLSEDTIKGYLLTSAYGGGTVMTEYEFLTGNSLYFFPSGTSPFVQYLTDSRPSLATRLKNLGYTVTAYHPYMKSSYNRAAGYERLGFDIFYTIEDDLPCTETLRGYVTDSADFKNLIYLYETRDKTRPFFIFNVTMQNHGGYYTTGEEESLILPTDEELDDDELIGYLCLIHETDKALRELIEYFSQADSEVIILFFGDHQPTVPILYPREGDERFSSGMPYNYSSFLIWANFDIEEKEGVVTSPNFLRSMLLSAAGAELDPYEEFLIGASEEITSINSAGHTDAAGIWYYRGQDDTPLMDRYRYLVYANAFDKEFLSGTAPASYFE